MQTIGKQAEMEIYTSTSPTHVGSTCKLSLLCQNEKKKGEKMVYLDERGKPKEGGGRKRRGE